MVDTPQTTSPAPAAPAPERPPDNRAASPLHQPTSPASIAVAERSRSDPQHPQNRGDAIDVTAFTQLPAREQAKYSARPSAAGGSEFVLRDGQTAPATDKPAESAKGAVVRFSDGQELDEAALRDALAFKAAADSRKATLPASPDGYKAELPADLQLPAGVKYEIDPRDPMVDGYRRFALEAGLDQQTFSKGLGLVAMLRANEQAQIEAAYNAEVAKLGMASAARVDAVLRWIDGAMGEHAAGMRRVLQIAPTADTIKAFEHHITKLQNQSGASFSPTHREQAPERPSQEQYASWTFAQKQNYAHTGDHTDSSWATTEGQRVRLAPQRG